MGFKIMGLIHDLFPNGFGSWDVVILSCNEMLLL